MFQDEKVKKWLTSLVISIITSIFLTQPIKVSDLCNNLNFNEFIKKHLVFNIKRYQLPAFLIRFVAKIFFNLLKLLVIQKNFLMDKVLLKMLNQMISDFVSSHALCHNIQEANRERRGGGGGRRR